VLAVELRPEETGCPLENFVGSLEFTVLLLERPHPRRLARAHPAHVALIDVSLADPGPHRLDAITQLGRDPPDRAVLGAQLGSVS